MMCAASTKYRRTSQLFVGVNNHADPRINELTGATKDATALWSLFTVSVDGVLDRRLVDEQATATSVRQALDDSLGAATAEDTVVFFAGTEHELMSCSVRREH